MFPSLSDAADCPCGSGRTYGGCCAPAHRGTPALSPEALMRSRYSAFVIGDGAYLHATWHPGTRPESVEPDPEVRWTGLEILDVSGGAAGERRGTVEFRATWQEAGHRGVLHERSRFVRQSERWWYLDGTIG